MQNLTESMRSLIDSMNEAIDITYDKTKAGVIKKVIAKLDASDSATFTKLGKALLAISKREEQIKQLKAGIKEDDKVRLASLFAAEDCVQTRVVETAKFIFTLSKDPVAATTVKYANVIEEIRVHLTPELIVVLDGLIKTHSTDQAPKPPGLKISSKDPDYDPDIEDEVDPKTGELLESTTADPYANLLLRVQKWAAAYDRVLAAIKKGV